MIVNKEKKFANFEMDCGNKLANFVAFPFGHIIL